MIGFLPSHLGRGTRPYFLLGIGFALITAPLLLIWLGYKATGEWQRSTQLLVEQRASEVATLMIMALNRDMRGVQLQALPQLEPGDGQTAPGGATE